MFYSLNSFLVFGLFSFPSSLTHHQLTVRPGKVRRRSIAHDVGQALHQQLLIDGNNNSLVFILRLLLRKFCACFGTGMKRYNPREAKFLLLYRSRNRFRQGTESCVSEKPPWLVLLYKKSSLS